MNKYLSLLGIMFLLTLIACQNDDEGDGTLALKFEAKVNNTPLEFNKYYVINGDSVKFELFKFYVSDFKIEDKNNTEKIEAKDVTVVDFTNDVTTINTTLPADAYKNPSFNIGLTVAQNESEPTDYASAHPLSAQQGNYWMMANSYIYVKLEGQYMMNGVEESFVYHLGHNDYVRNVELEKSFSIHEGNTTNVLASLNMSTIFDNIDFTTESTTHSANPLAEKMLSNFMNSLSVN